jgi:hypothetical protein
VVNTLAITCLRGNTVRARVRVRSDELLTAFLEIEKSILQFKGGMAEWGNPT